MGGREEAREGTRLAMGGIHCDRLLPRNLKQTRQNVKILLTWYVVCITFMLFAFNDLKYLLKSNTV